VALVMSALLMLGLTIIQAHEDTLLGRIEEYCMENVLDRLWVPPLHEQMASAISRSFSTLPARLAEELSRRQQE
jgi:hypothetical protein